VRWAIVAVVVAVTAIAAINVLLLSYGSDRHDPVGRLTPIANLPAQTVKRQPLPPPATVDDSSGHARGNDD
jgi:hypothetical protein